MFGRNEMTTKSTRKGVLARLRSDTGGNTLAMVAAALIPIAAMIGGGVDMSRAYMAKSRLQSACDAASLAGRRIMRNNTLSSDVTAETLRFFNFNFEQGKYETAAFTPVVTQPTPGVLRVTASTTIPTSIMSLFGFETLPLDVSCDASLNFVNTDIVLVLDITGSMNCRPSETPLCGRTTEVSDSRIVALREAVMALYDELAPIQAQLEANGQRLRFGIVPYSTTVNVGNLIADVDPNFLRATAPYQSREANYTTPVITGYTPNAPTTAPRVSQTNGTTLTSAQCTTWGNTNNGSEPTLAGGPPPTATTSTTYDWRDWGATGTTTGTRRTCRRWATVTTTTYTPITRYGFTSWTYRQVSDLDVSALRDGTPVNVASSLGNLTGVPGGTLAAPTTSTTRLNEREVATLATGATTTPLTWNGCIEERDTVNTINGSSGYTIPANAFDLQIDTMPTNDATRWRMRLPNMIYMRASGVASSTTATVHTIPSNESACPTEARRLQAWTRANLQTYVNSLRGLGYTYHDVGMTWGARFISAAGVFADSPDTFGGMPVARHIIYMTDGQLQPLPSAYTAWGVDYMDNRVTTNTSTTSDTAQQAAHGQRFRMICNSAKNNNTSIWVIAFATALTTDLTNCASNSDQASTSTDRDQLIARFRQIGNQIGALRLTE